MNCQPIGVIRTCFREKFGVPRQSLMLDKAWGIIQLNPDFNFISAIDKLETFSHIWVLFEFHLRGEGSWHPKISPPRLDIQKVGVLASRSPHRPNPIGMSVVKLDRIEILKTNEVEIHCSGVDILDGTPVLDIKPYLPYADIVSAANSGWASSEIESYEVSFSTESLIFLRDQEKEKFTEQLELFTQVLSLDPRPSSQRKSIPIKAQESEGKIFRFRFSRYDIEWKIENSHIKVLRFIPM